MIKGNEKMKEKLHYFLSANTAGMRLARTILQAVIGVIIANIDYLIGQIVIDPAMRPVIVALVMAVLSPVMKALGGEEIKPEAV